MWQSRLDEAHAREFLDAAMTPSAGESTARRQVAEARMVLRYALRWSPEELRLLGALRSFPQPAGIVLADVCAPRAELAHVADLHRRIGELYGEDLATARERQGMAATQDALTAACLSPWLPGDLRDELQRPFRALLGGTTGATFGPQAVAVASLLLQVHGLTAEAAAAIATAHSALDSAARDATRRAAQAAAEITARMHVLHGSADSIEILVGMVEHLAPGSRETIAEAACLAAAALVLGDVIPSELEVSLRSAWSAGFPVRAPAPVEESPR